ncbi:DNA helicase II [Candidatus Coxiella mudrowiae]|uniref:DNA 3'-5' helicase n=1 Tax=Candidatus Coxiella mudrowiae TaxID=2054173 RepID=A0ABN4HQW3_9COXI|nr:DNA helicase II [Candidatus Coxiella mudrowiae]AKQ34023.1 DNA helicase II [Candidatus Coxiella mudrowiae]
MDDMENLVLLQSLNPQQKEAVTSLSPYVRVLAGAGSGKTRILTYRIAWLIQQQGVPPYSILAVTFTNKAAYEMRGRIEAMLGIPIRTMWVGTFHGLAHRLLRVHWKEVDLPQSFQILDSDDQYRLIRRVQRSLNLEETQWPPKQTQWFINKQKEKGWRPHQVANSSDDSYFTEVLVKVYKAYEEVCRRSGLVDFSELLLRSLELLRDVPSIRHHYQQRFHHILVDEFQDTNTIQYAWLCALMGDNTGMMAVGDDDQSIYSWRGAKIENIHRFSRDFTDVQTIRLEQNYRSTQTILDAANAVIENNTNRLGKKLWTTSNTGERISLYTAFNERDEAFYIISCIESWIQQERKYSDIAILYRSNAQSRLLEERLIDRQIPYRIYGGLKFFERTEIKDALAYLRLLANRHDDAAFERVVNTPTRGIGNTTLITLRAAARDQGISLWQAAMDLINNQGLSARALNSLQQFLNLIETLSAQTKNLSLAEQTEKILNQSGLLALYKKDKNEKGLSRVENLEELISATSQFTPEPMTDETILLSPLDGFLSHVALETGEEQASSHSDCVNLMTLHSAKGLEFPLVIIGGLEENLFPHHMSTDSENGLEEERRLCYVGMTRAKEKLILTYAECRHLHGLEKFNQPSRFLNEIPPELIDIVRPTPKISRPVSITYQRPQAGESEFYVGQRVNHTKFGSGIIINYEGQGENTRLQVKFDSHGEKWLVSSYAKLEALS